MAELLVHVGDKSAKRAASQWRDGHVISVQADGHQWSPIERRRYLIVEVAGDPDPAWTDPDEERVPITALMIDVEGRLQIPAGLTPSSEAGPGGAADERLYLVRRHGRRSQVYAYWDQATSRQLQAIRDPSVESPRLPLDQGRLEAAPRG